MLATENPPEREVNNMDLDSPSGQPPAMRQMQTHIKEALQHIHDADRRTREASKGHPNHTALGNTIWAAEWALRQAQAELQGARSTVEHGPRD